jgi:hypothetical protein
MFSRLLVKNRSIKEADVIVRVIKKNSCETALEDVQVLVMN